jgi:hypothetical protein
MDKSSIQKGDEMKKIIILLGVFSILVSCTENKVKSGSLPIQNILTTSGEENFMGLEAIDLEMNDQTFEVSKLSNSKYEIHTSKDEMLEFIESDSIKVNLTIDRVMVPKGITIKNLKLSLTDSTGKSYFETVLDNPYENVSLVIKGRENILNFIARKKFLSIGSITLLDFERNRLKLDFEQKVSIEETDCRAGFYKETIKTLQTKCLSKDFVSIVSVYERRAILNEVQRTSKVTYTKNKTGISISGDRTLHAFEFMGFEFQKVEEYLFTDLHSFTQLDLNTRTDHYFVGISHYEDAHGEYLDKGVLERSLKGNYFVDGNFIDTNHFGKHVEYEVLRETTVDIVVFE